MPDTRYSPPTIALHWLMAVLLIGLLGLGLYMHELPLSPDKLKLYSWHKSAGVTAFLLALLRLLWRLGNRPPPLPTAMSCWQKATSHALHHLFYVLMIAIPLTGWLMSSAKGFQTVYFGVLPLPDLLGKDKELGELLQTAHKFLNITLAALLVAHIGAALKHHLFDRDDVLTRMLPLRKRTHDRGQERRQGRR